MKTYTLKEILFDFCLKQDILNKLVIYCSEKDVDSFHDTVKKLLPPNCSSWSDRSWSGTFDHVVVAYKIGYQHQPSKTIRYLQVSGDCFKQNANLVFTK